MFRQKALYERIHLTCHRFLHLELDLPLTGLISLESHIGMPSFNQPFCEADDRANKSSHFETHYASLVALRGVCATLHSNINECKSPQAF